MTTYVRCTGYILGTEPLTVVVELGDLAVDTAAEYKEHMLTQIPVAYIVMDQFEFDGDTDAAIQTAIAQMEEQQEEETEAASLHHWIGTVLPNSRQHVAVPMPSRMSVERLTDVLEQVARHPDYASQMVQCYVLDDNGKLTEVAMKDGEVTTQERGSFA